MSATTDHAAASPCCPLPPGVPALTIETEREDEERLQRLARRAHALSDPVRLRMLGVIVAAGRCCRPSPASGAGAPDVPAGVCVCELQSVHGLAQSKVSYHLKVLREAGLVREQRRGKWGFYGVDEEAAADFVAAAQRQLGL